MDLKIRTITFFLDGLQFKNEMVEKASSLLEEKGLKPRTSRVTLPDINSENLEHIKDHLFSFRRHFWGVCVPLSLVDDPNASFEFLHTLKSVNIKNSNIFINFDTVSPSGEIKTQYFKKIAENIKRMGEADPISNFRVGVSGLNADCSPFFPFSRNTRDTEGFSVGLEYVGLLTDLVEEHNRENLGNLRQRIISTLVPEILRVHYACQEISELLEIPYFGIDLSMAPYPYPLEDQSIAKLIEVIGNIGRSRGSDIFEFGDNGTMFIHSYLSKIIKDIAHTSNIPTVGFNGIMYSILEDTYLSERYAQGKFDITLLKLLATTCGCGLDMIPVMEDIEEEALVGMLLDNCAESVLLDKPLGVRILPIANKRVGDKTKFRHLFFANTIIQDIGFGATFLDLPAQKDKGFGF